MVDKNEWAVQAYGMDTTRLVSEKPEYYSAGRWALCILSDVQELISRAGDPAGDLETARRWVNKAKYWIAETEKRDQAISTELPQIRP